ncbi:alpha/beta fold hydrolase [Streptomyces sp. NPDC051555]|uniref:alpha/beta fold hydrolase n=1 Tax=Streptomyces sp. NPDC051555 TaxID=3365657 RepID=UPI0037BDCF5F
MQHPPSPARHVGAAGRRAVRAAPPAFAVALALACAPLAHAAMGTDTPHGSSLDWKPCTQVAAEWDAKDTATECAMVEVPLEYGSPDGRLTRVAISRIKASDPAQRQGVLLINPGGPGVEGLTAPKDVLSGEMRALGAHFDLIGFDIRGTGHSDKPGCPQLAADTIPRPPAHITGKERSKLLDAAYGQALAECAGKDPAFSQSMTTPNAARDMDRIRAALGEEKVSYLGNSWGTALGASYRSQFDSRVQRMVFDSVLASWQSVDENEAQVAATQRRFENFAAWIAERHDRLHLGDSATQVSKKLLNLRTELETHPHEGVSAEAFNTYLTSPRAHWASNAHKLSEISAGRAPEPTPRPALAPSPTNGPGSGFGQPLQDGDLEFVLRAFNCNGATGQRTFENHWQQSLTLQQKYPVAGYTNANITQCSGWPFAGQREQLAKGTSPLQLFGHSTETNTPLPWAEQMKDTIGGSLSIINDDVHSSLPHLTTPAHDAVAFLTGHSEPSHRTYDGSPIPDLH